MKNAVSVMVSARHLPFIHSLWLCLFKENSPHTALHLRAIAYPRPARASPIMGYKKRNRLEFENRLNLYYWTIFMAWAFLIPWLFLPIIRIDKIIWVKWPCDSLQIMRWNDTNYRTFWRSSQNNLTARISQLLLFHVTHWQPALYHQRANTLMFNLTLLVFR